MKDATALGIIEPEGLISLRDWKSAAKEGNTPDHACIRKQYATEVKQLDVEARTVEFVISTESVDRDSDTIRAAGWELDNYLRNPVVQFAHDYWTPAIAGAINVRVIGRALASVARFPSREELDLGPSESFLGGMIFNLIRLGIHRAASVGFDPLEWVFNEDRQGRGFSPPVDFIRQDLLEWSVVPVPANPEALVAASKAGVDLTPLKLWATQALDFLSTVDEDVPLLVTREALGRAYKIAEGERLVFRVPADYPDRTEIEGGLTMLSKHLREHGIGAALHVPDEIELAVERAIIDGHGSNAAEFEIIDDAKGGETTAYSEERDVIDPAPPKSKGVISYRSAHSEGTPLAEKDAEWNGRSEVAAAEVDELRIMSSWVDADNADAKSAYKLPHHRASAAHPVVFRGVRAAAARLNQTDVPEGDVAGIQRHLGRHYREFDEVAPWDRNESAWTALAQSCATFRRNMLDEGEPIPDPQMRRLLTLYGFELEARALIDVAPETSVSDEAWFRDLMAELKEPATDEDELAFLADLDLEDPEIRSVVADTIREEFNTEARIRAGRLD